MSELGDSELGEKSLVAAYQRERFVNGKIELGKSYVHFFLKYR